MPQFLITGPDGKKYKVTGADANGALNALKSQLGHATGDASPPPVPQPNAAPPPSGNPGMWSTAAEALDTLTSGGQSKLNAAGGALVDSAFDYAKGNGWNYGDNYNKILQEQRDNQSTYNEQNPGLTALGQAGGIALGIARGPVWGAGLKGAAVTGAGYGAAGGALTDANSIGERIKNTAVGAGTGGFIGGTGYGLGKVIAKGAEKVSRAFSTLNAPPLTKAESEVYDLIQKAGGPAAVQQKLAQLGPEAALADVLGSSGTAAGRRAANISPEAREILTDFVSGRKAGQNTRLAADIETASGLPVGNTKNVEALKKDANAKLRPQINAAYAAARKAGYDIPLDLFDNIITTPVGVKAFRQALDNVTSRAARDPSAGGNLAVLDETKRLLDGYATQGFRIGDPMAGEYADTAKALRAAVDSHLASGNEYSAARGLRQNAYKSDEAFDLGAQLGGSRIPLGLPQAAGKVAPQFQPNVAQGYGAQKVESLLNKGATEGAYADMITPQGRAASQAALGPRNSIVENALGRERQFNITNKEIVGNSTSARQIAEMAGYGMSAAAVSQLMGNDIWTTGLTGLLGAVGRKALPTIAQKLVTKNQRTVAPFLADILTKAGLPTTRPIPPGFLEKVVTGGDQKLAKTLYLMWAQHLQSSEKTKPQTNLAYQ